MAKRTNRFLLWQKIAVAAAIALIVGLLGALYLMVLTEAPLGEFIEGEHYALIEDPRRVRGDKVEVMEFFSYGCIHCYNLEDDLNDWVDANTDRVNFVRTPALANNYWRILGRAYYTMEELGVLAENHTRLFREIHDRGRTIDSVDNLASWIDGNGTTGAAFRSMFNSSVIDRNMASADSMARRLRIASVPTIVVNGKYMVRMSSQVGPSRMFEVMEHLIQKELAPETGEEGPSENTTPDG